MIPTFIASFIFGIAIIVASSAILSSGWLKTPLIILGIVIAIIGIGSMIITIWGKYIGFSRHFTP